MRYKRFNEKLGLCACASRRESVRVKAGLPSAACSCRPERNSLIRSSVQCTVASGAGAIVFCSVLEVTESINRYCLFFAAIGGFFAAGIF